VKLAIVNGFLGVSDRKSVLRNIRGFGLGIDEGFDRNNGEVKRRQITLETSQGMCICIRPLQC
jgi:hypothetical protein